MGLLDRIVDDVFSEFSDSGRKFFESFHPAADVYKCKDDEIIVDIDLPGIDGCKIKYEINGGQDVCGCWFEWAHLYLKVHRKSSIPKDCETYFSHRPCDIVTRIPLPIRIKKGVKPPVAGTPKYKDGVLTFSIPTPPGLMTTVIGQKASS